MLPEFVDALHHFARLAEEAQVLALSFQGLAVKVLEFGFVIESVEMTDAATAEDLYHPFCLRREMRQPRRSRHCPRLFAIQEPRQRYAAEANSGVGKEVSARKQRNG